MKSPSLSVKILEALKKLLEAKPGDTYNYRRRTSYIRPFGLIQLLASKSNFYNSTTRLSKNGLIKKRKVGPNIEIAITTRGLDFLQRKTKRGIDRPKKWDGLWRMVIFDVPEKNRKSRDLFRNKLKELGFTQIQKSAWVYPFPCRRELLELSKTCKILPFTTLFEGRYLGIDRGLKKIYSL